MKINEKNLCGFAVSDSPVDKVGWLLKRGEVNKSFQRRWFTLKGNLLFYFEKKTDKEPSGVIVLEGCTIELAEYEEQYAFKIVFHGAGDRTYVLGADTQETMEAWMKALACASYDYMKLMVSELQRQLDEIVELEKAHASIFDDAKQKGAASKTEPAAPAIAAAKSDKQPQAPSRLRRGNSQPKKTVAVTGQRLNPFDRDADVGDVPQLKHASSAPGTPQITRQAPPPPPTAAAVAVSAAKSSKCNNTHNANSAFASRQLEHSLLLKGAESTTSAASSVPSHLCRPLFMLQELYGAKIVRDVELWNRKRAAAAKMANKDDHVGRLVDLL